MDYKLAMSILDPKISFAEMESHDKFLKSLDELMTPYDMKRLESYTNNLADFHLILDLVPVLSDLYFQEKLPLGISYTQASVLLCMGLQYQNVSYIEGSMGLERHQILSLFIKVIKKLYKYLYRLARKEVDSARPRLEVIGTQPHDISMEEDLNEAVEHIKDDKTNRTIQGRKKDKARKQKDGYNRESESRNEGDDLKSNKRRKSQG